MIKAFAVNGVPNVERKSCIDCSHCVASVSWWCKNDEAIERRGTQIPGAINCSNWEPIPTKQELYENSNVFGKLFGTYKTGYIEVDLSK